MNIGIYIYENAEVLDFSGPFEVFATAARLSNSKTPINVFLIGETGEAIAARGGYSINPKYSFIDHPPIDLLIVVGGVHTEEVKKEHVLNWISKTSLTAEIVASVCTGAFLLAEANILTHQKVTTHWEDIPCLEETYPDLTVIKNKRWVDEGNIITSGGISAGIDMSLYLVSKLFGAQLAIKTSKQMEFDWTYD